MNCHVGGMTAYGLMWVGLVLTIISSNPWAYGIGRLLVIGFDKMFAVYNRMLRQRLVPP